MDGFPLNLSPPTKRGPVHNCYLRYGTRHTSNESPLALVY